MFAIIGGLASLALTALLIGGLFAGGVFLIGGIGICWTAVCAAIAAGTRWNDAAAWVFGTLALAATITALVMGALNSQLSISVMFFFAVLAYGWARHEIRAARRRRIQAELARRWAVRQERRMDYERRAARGELSMLEKLLGNRWT